MEPFEFFVTEHFVFYCSPNTPAHQDIKAIIAEREAALRRVCDFAGAKPDEKIIVFFYPDQATKHRCTFHRGDGLARGRMIAEVHNEQVKLDPYHELTHIVMRRVGNPPAVFSEGFAVYMAERMGSRPRNHLKGAATLQGRARDILVGGQWIPLEELLTYEEIGSTESRPGVSYGQAGAFVRFLIDTYGREKFLRAHGETRSAQTEKDVRHDLGTLEAIYGRPVVELERQWKDALGKVPGS